MVLSIPPQWGGGIQLVYRHWARLSIEVGSCWSSHSDRIHGTRGKQAEAAHIRLLLDCAEICQTSANFMLRGSELQGDTCGACAEVCDRYAQACAQFGDDK